MTSIEFYYDFRRNTVAAYGRGVFGVPTFILGEELYFGADRMELLSSQL
jgi:2-hydroxychromene-2-carboxylate isomerase